MQCELFNVRKDASGYIMILGKRPLALDSETGLLHEASAAHVFCNWQEAFAALTRTVRYRTKGKQRYGSDYDDYEVYPIKAP